MIPAIRTAGHSLSGSGEAVRSVFNTPVVDPGYADHNIVNAGFWTGWPRFFLPIPYDWDEETEETKELPTPDPGSPQTTINNVVMLGAIILGALMLVKYA